MHDCKRSLVRKTSTLVVLNSRPNDPCCCFSWWGQTPSGTMTHIHLEISSHSHWRIYFKSLILLKGFFSQPKSCFCSFDHHSFYQFWYRYTHQCHWDVATVVKPRLYNGIQKGNWPILQKTTECIKIMDKGTMTSPINLLSPILNLWVTILDFWNQKRWGLTC